MCAHSLKAQPEGGVQNLIDHNPLLTEIAIDFFFFNHSTERTIFYQFPFKLLLEVAKMKMESYSKCTKDVYAF